MTQVDTADPAKRQRLSQDLDAAIERLANARDFAKPAKLMPVLDLARRLMLADGFAEIEARSQALEAAGVFAGTDWAQPHILLPALTCHSLKSPSSDVVVIEALSELRLLAIAMGDVVHAKVSAEQAHHFLTQVLAINLSMLFTPMSEAERESQGRLAKVPRAMLTYLAERIGFEYVMDQLIAEIWRILRQRPIQVDSVKQMVTQIAICRGSANLNLNNTGLGTEALIQGADRLVSSLFGPTQLCREDPGVAVYAERLQHLDSSALQSEAFGCSRAMHDTGLVSPYHAVLLRTLCESQPHLIVDALGLSGTGRDSLLCYHDLVKALIEEAVTPHTPQAIYGLTLMLERGILYQPAVAPSLWRQLSLGLSPWSQQRLNLVFGSAVSPRTRLLEGVLLMLGLPLGIGQGNNPTCQSARALSIWSHIDPDFLLQLIASAARDDEIIMHFEGQPISSAPALEDTARPLPIDLDPVSILLVPHLDFIYGAMGRLCAGREGDPHRWINPEFHGWRVCRGFRINVNVATGQLENLEDFLRHFYAYYHPYYNGNQPLIHPQPAGIAITDSAARFIGWHAITIQRVALDPNGVMRVYFYNPNNDSGQDWGDGVVVCTADNGELYGESSLEFERFASRVYIFHYDTQEPGEPDKVPMENIATIQGYIQRSWGKERCAELTLQASPGAPQA
ncbi:MAG: hypothetical protein CSH49_12885 [Alcanivorax sp.]|jgi:hypothetical protein|nr:hypothetical protein [Pseudomonadales bacterium]MEC8809787.1 hypothetical protein [Pseudomonadota bacterium]TNC88128.1 MAG: hypothetical protein CSH49_12885 [Alcanivorax sp.]